MGYESTVIKQIPSADAFHDQWRIQKMAAELQYKRYAQWVNNSCYRREAEVLLCFQGERGHGNNVAQLEVSPPQASVGAAKWREAVKFIEQNRNPSHKAGIFEARKNTDRLTIELKPVVNFANLKRGSAANEVMQVVESKPLYREEEGRTSAVIEGGESKNLVAQIVSTEEFAKSGSCDKLQQANLSKLQDKEEQGTNAEVLDVNNVVTAKSIVEKLRGQYKDFIQLASKLNLHSCGRNAL